jgi:hypothetical protein
MRHSLPVIAMLFLLFPLAGLGQHGGRHGSSSSGSAGTTPAEDPDTATFKRAVAAQATDTQIAQFHSMTKSTEAARQQAQGLQQPGSNANHSEELTSKATALQDAVDQALSDTHKFRQSFTDSQETTLKTLARKLMKSDAAVNKSSKAISHELEQQTPNQGRLVSAAANLQKELEALQSVQLNVGKEMGIQSQ